MVNTVVIVVKRFGTSSKHLLLNKIVFAISNRKTKTTKLLLIQYIKITKFFVIESHHQVSGDVILSRKAS